MNTTKATQQTVIVIILAIISVIMLPLDFYNGKTCLELMERADFHGILLYIYYITFATTILFAFLQKIDFSKMSIIIHSIVMGVLLLMSIDFHDGDFLGDMGPAILGCSICSVISLIVLTKKDTKTN